MTALAIRDGMSRAAYGAPLARRKPRLQSELDGEHPPRIADRQYLAERYQPPPRSTRFEPVPGPVGSTDGELE